MNRKPPAVLVSVVIPCYNGLATIERTLNALDSQDTEFPYEVIVVDSSDDGTDRMIRKKFPEVRLFHLPKKTLPGSGRNYGVRESLGSIVAFTDADCIPRTDWIQKIVERIRKTDCDAVGGSVQNGYPGSVIAWVSHLIEFNEWTPGTTERYETNNPSCNLAYKREAFDRYRLEFTDNFPSEDTILNWELTSQGGRLYFDPAVRILHLNRIGFRKLLQHQYRLGKAVAVERGITDYPGRLFLRFRILCLGLPILRWVLALFRLLKNDIKTALIFLSVTPLFLLAATAWALGFMKRMEPRNAEIRIHSQDG